MNNVRTGHPTQTLRKRLENQHRRTRTSVAISDPEHQLTRDELMWRVNKTAPDLHQRFGESNSPYLPMFVDDTIESAVALLACLVEGIPFAPLDPRTPAERTGRVWNMLGRPTSWWAASGVNPAIPEGIGPGSTDIQAESVVPEEERGLVIFTSGSTGFPKGVELSRITLEWRQERESKKHSESHVPEVVSSFAPFHFMGGLSPLMRIFNGDAIHIIRPGEHSLPDILRELDRRGVTSLQVPPQLGRLMAYLDEKLLTPLDSVTNVRMGSEAIRFEWLAGMKRFLSPEVIVRHGLGSTEGSRSFQNEFVLADAPESGQVPLGRPINPARMKLVAAEGLPDGGKELWISGPIASGYLGNPQLTEERFVHDESGTRYWRSGDLVEEGQDGVFHHRGRNDDVVKVRGMLASPSEAARVIGLFPGVHVAVVLPHTQNGNTRLIAHVQTGSGSDITASRLRDLVKVHLPDHLAPSEFILYDTLPTTVRGKIDRSALQAAHPSP